jgi:LysM repeat protein
MPRTYTVQPGDTLSGIAQQQLGNASRWPEIFVLNRSIIQHPDRISPGQVLTLPGDTPCSPHPASTLFGAATPCRVSPSENWGMRAAGPRSSSATVT